MLFFSKEKDLIHRLTNAVLVIWFIIAVVSMYISVVNLIFSGSPYEVNASMHYDAKSVFYALGNVAIVGGALYYLNKKKR